MVSNCSLSARTTAWLGAVAAAEALTGSADMCLLTALAAGGRLLFWRQAARPAAGRAVAAAVAGAVALAFALSAVQWLPSASLLRSVERGRLGPGEILYWSVHPLSLVDLFVPRFFADLPLSPALRAALFEGREPFLVSLYVGLSSLALVFFVRPGRWEPRSYAAAMALAFGLVALGRHVVLLPWLLTTPPFSLSRYPAKYAIPFAMFWALVAGFGLDGWRRPWVAGDRRRAAVALALMCLIAVATGAGALQVARDVRPAMRLLRPICSPASCRGRPWSRSPLRRSSRCGYAATTSPRRSPSPWRCWPEPTSPRPAATSIRSLLPSSSRTGRGRWTCSARTSPSADCWRPRRGWPGSTRTSSGGWPAGTGGRAGRCLHGQPLGREWADGLSQFRHRRRHGHELRQERRLSGGQRNVELRAE